MLIFKLFLLSLVSFTTTDLRVLFFTMDSCPPCKQTEPGIDQLRDEGVAVSKIDVRQYQDYARQCRVQQTPTVMVVDGNRVLARHTGALDYAALRQMLNRSSQSTENAQRPAVTPVSQSDRSSTVDASVELNRQQRTGTTQPGATTGAGMTPEQRAYQATVRFRVEDAEGTSYATGTVIHRQGNEALVLTCGHVFRDSQGKGKIHSDLGFSTGNPKTVIGKLLAYDADNHDIALVAIPCPFDIEPVPVAPEQLNVQTGDAIFSLGCDRGADPTVRRSKMKAVTRYSGVSKYDIVGRPVDGRSGGGLFTAGGQLIGVCNAAAVEVDEGIYTGLQSVYWQFAKTNLTHLFRREATPAALSFEPASAVAQQTRNLAPQNNVSNTGTENVVARGNELVPPTNTAIHRGGDVPVNSAVYRGNEMPIRNAAHSNTSAGSGSDTELIVVVRSRNDPSITETITISNPDEQTLRWIRESGRPNGPAMSDRSRLAERMAQLPELQNRNPSAASATQMRAQSPR